MRFKLIIFALCGLLFFGCKKADTNTPKRVTNHKTKSQSNPQLENLQRLLLADSKSTIHCMVGINSGLYYYAGKTKPFYNTFGSISDAKDKQKYIFSIGDNCTREAVFSDNQKKYIIQSTEEEINQVDYSGIFAKNVPYKLLLNDSQPVYDGVIQTPVPILLDTINRFRGKDDVVIKWNTDAHNEMGVIIDVTAYDEKNQIVGRVYDLFPDKGDGLDISYMINEFPEITHFVVFAIRGNYAQRILDNGDAHTLLVYSTCSSSVQFEKN